DQPGSVSHVINPARLPQIRGDGHPATIIAYPDHKAVAFTPDDNFDETGRCMLRDVIEGFLHDTIDEQLIDIGKLDVIELARARESGQERALARFGSSSETAFNCRHEPKSVERRRTKILHRTPHFVHSGVQTVDQLR